MIFATEHDRIDDSVKTLWRVEYRAWDHSKGSKPLKVTNATWHANQEAAEMDAKTLGKRSDVFFVAISKWERSKT